MYILEFSFISAKGYQADFGPWLKPIKIILNCNLLHSTRTISAFTEIFTAVSQESLFKLKMSYLAFIQLLPSLLPKHSSKQNSPRKASKIKRGQKSSSFLLGPGETPELRLWVAWGYLQISKGKLLLRNEEHRMWNRIMLNVPCAFCQVPSDARCPSGLEGS